MAHRLHTHIIASSRRVIVGLRVLLAASGLVDRISVQDPNGARTNPDADEADLTVLDLACLAPLEPPRALLKRTIPSGVPWCALVHNQAQESQAIAMGAAYILPLGFAPELLFSILAGCLPVVQKPAFSPVRVVHPNIGPFA
jgi:hypothetical protein